MSALLSPTRPAPAGAGQRVELAAYTLPDGTGRILIGQRVDGVVRVSDLPSGPGGGRAHLVERGLEQDGHAALTALVDDYLAQAARLGRVPMATSPLERYLEGAL